MKAIVCRKYGSPDVLELEEVLKPIPKDDVPTDAGVAELVDASDLKAVGVPG